MIGNSISSLETGRAPEKRAQVSFKAAPADIVSGSYDATITAYAADAMARGFQIFLTYWHEPNGELQAGTFTPAAYKAAHVYISQLLWSLPSRNVVTPMLCFSARKTRIGAPYDPSWCPSFASMQNPKAVLSWDSYGFPGGTSINGVAQRDLSSQYPPMDQIFSLMMGDTVTAGYNFDGGWGLTETNTPIRSWDVATRTGRIAYYRATIDYMLHSGPPKSDGSGPAKPHHVFVWSGTDANWNNDPKAGWDAGNVHSGLITGDPYGTTTAVVTAELKPWRDLIATSI